MRLGKRESAAAQQAGNPAGVDAVVFAFAAVNQLHIERVSQYKGGLLFLTQIGQPVSAEDQFHAHDQALPIRSDQLEKRLRVAGDALIDAALPSWSRMHTCMVLECRSMPP
jgi:hypothetical protein